MGEIDLPALRQLASEAQQLQDAGRWTESEFLRIFNAAKPHTGKVRGAMSFLFDSAEPE